MLIQFNVTFTFTENNDFSEKNFDTLAKKSELKKLKRILVNLLGVYAQYLSVFPIIKK